jgi:hypothetical protein
MVVRTATLQPLHQALALGVTLTHESLFIHTHGIQCSGEGQTQLAAVLCAVGGSNDAQRASLAEFLSRVSTEADEQALRRLRQALLACGQAALAAVLPGSSSSSSSGSSGSSKPLLSVSNALTDPQGCSSNVQVLTWPPTSAAVLEPAAAGQHAHRLADMQLRYGVELVAAVEHEDGSGAMFSPAIAAAAARLAHIKPPLVVDAAPVNTRSSAAYASSTRPRPSSTSSEAERRRQHIAQREPLLQAFEATTAAGGLVMFGGKQPVEDLLLSAEGFRGIAGVVVRHVPATGAVCRAAVHSLRAAGAPALAAIVGEAGSMLPGASSSWAGFYLVFRGVELAALVVASHHPSAEAVAMGGRADLVSSVAAVMPGLVPQLLAGGAIDDVEKLEQEMELVVETASSRGGE